MKEPSDKYCDDKDGNESCRLLSGLNNDEPENICEQVEIIDKMISLYNK